MVDNSNNIAIRHSPPLPGMIFKLLTRMGAPFVNDLPAEDRIQNICLQQLPRREALVEYERTREIAGDTPQVAAYVAYALAVSGKATEARALLAELKQRATRQYIPPYDIALIYVGLGETGQAFAWIEKAYTDRSTEMIYCKVEPMLKPLRSDPRYEALLRRLGLAR